MKMRIPAFFVPVIGTAALFGAGGSGQLSSGTLFAASVVNFALFLFLLVRFGKAPIASFFAAREADIRAAFETYRADYEKTEAEIARLRKAIADIAAEKERTLADYRRRAEELYATRLDEARAQAAYFREISETLLRAEARERSLAAISAFADQLSRDLAERSRSFDTQRHRAMVRSCAALFERTEAPR